LFEERKVAVRMLDVGYWIVYSMAVYRLLGYLYCSTKESRKRVAILFRSDASSSHSIAINMYKQVKPGGIVEQISRHIREYWTISSYQPCLDSGETGRDIQICPMPYGPGSYLQPPEE
jgi:hypothetical protein